jgi:hypothetical protein
MQDTIDNNIRPDHTAYRSPNADRHRVTCQQQPISQTISHRQSGPSCTLITRKPADPYHNHGEISFDDRHIAPRVTLKPVQLHICPERADRPRLPGPRLALNSRSRAPANASVNRPSTANLAVLRPSSDYRAFFSLLPVEWGEGSCGWRGVREGISYPTGFEGIAGCIELAGCCWWVIMRCIWFA